MTTKVLAKVLIVDDEPGNRELVKDILSKKYEVIGAGDGEEGRRVAIAEIPDLILLDVTMPKMDGITLCKELRSHEATKHIPIIMLTAMNDDETRVDSFMKGADDYLPKPFKPTELLARVISKLRRVDEARGTTRVIECGNLTIDEDKMLVKLAGKNVELSALEFDLVRYFVKNKEKVLSRERILEAVWRDNSVSDRTIRTWWPSARS